MGRGLRLHCACSKFVRRWLSWWWWLWSKEVRKFSPRSRQLRHWRSQVRAVELGSFFACALALPVNYNRAESSWSILAAPSSTTHQAALCSSIRRRRRNSSSSSSSRRIIIIRGRRRRSWVSVTSRVPIGERCWRSWRFCRWILEDLDLSTSRWW